MPSSMFTDNLVRDTMEVVGEIFWQESPMEEIEAVHGRVRVQLQALLTLDALHESDRAAVIKAAASLVGQEPADWPREKAESLSEEQALYLLTVSPEYRAFIHRTDTGEIEILDVLRADTLQRFLESRRAEGVQG